MTVQIEWLQYCTYTFFLLGGEVGYSDRHSWSGMLQIHFNPAVSISLGFTYLEREWVPIPRFTRGIPLTWMEAFFDCVQIVPFLCPVRPDRAYLGRVWAVEELLRHWLIKKYILSLALIIPWSQVRVLVGPPILLRVFPLAALNARSKCSFTSRVNSAFSHRVRLAREQNIRKIPSAKSQ